MSTDFQHQHQRRRTALLVVLVGTAALSLQALLTTHHAWNMLDDNVIGPYGIDNNGAIGIGDNAQLLSLVEEIEMEEDQFHRILLPTMEEIYGKQDDEILAIPEDAMLSIISENGGALPDYLSSSTTATASAQSPYAQRIDDNQPLPPYTIEDAIKSSKMYERCFALLVYDPYDDAFYGLYSKQHYWVNGCEKLLDSIKNLAYLLRNIFQERFQGKESEELVIPISSGDYPGVRNSCIDGSGHDCSYNTAPILQFGSVFRHPHMFPSIIAMPMPTPHHLYCFVTWTESNSVCRHLRAIERELSGEEIGLKWKDLIPQVVWRGTDFSFLTKVHSKLTKPQFEERLINWPWSQTDKDKKTNKIGGQTAFNAAKKKRRLDYVRKHAPRTADKHDRILARFTKAAAVESLKNQYAGLLPRWKAALLTADAEVTASTPGSNALPWANMKFSTYVRSGHKTGARGAKEYEDWEGIGFEVTGDYKSPKTLAKYKYQIDLGGGGGTTWSGTIEKLAMPGLLFHHLTPTKDYLHDQMVPWVHYVPVASDLLDLKRKFDWAESHPVQAKAIADEGTKLVRYLASPEGYEEMYQQDMVGPLRRVMEAYRPISTNDQQTQKMTWRETIQEIEGDDVLFSLIKCSGTSVRNCDGGDIPSKKYTKKATREYMKSHGK